MPLVPIVKAGGEPFLFEVALVWDLDDERTQANARLIAAAPAMYEALEKAVRVMNTFGNITNWPEEMPQEYAEAINEGRTALAAARGES